MKLRNTLTNEIIEIEYRTDHAAGSYGQAVAVVVETGEALDLLSLAVYEEVRSPVAQAAATLGVAVPTVSKHARKLGIVKYGGRYLFTEADVAALRRSMDESKPGRPRKAQD